MMKQLITTNKRKISFICENCFNFVDMEISENTSIDIPTVSDTGSEVGCTVDVSNFYHAKCRKCGCSMIKRNSGIAHSYINLTACGVNVTGTSDGYVSTRLNPGGYVTHVPQYPNITMLLKKDQMNKLYNMLNMFKQYKYATYTVNGFNDDIYSGKFDYSKLDTKGYSILRISSVVPKEKIKDEDLNWYVHNCTSDIVCMCASIVSLLSKDNK